VLKSAMAQSQLPDEILIADDGSKEETKQLIAEFKNQQGSY
jgi:glycosyltransferase involved in cell wall biosynthesis